MNSTTEEARAILQNLFYMTVATSRILDGRSWIAPVTFWMKEDNKPGSLPQFFFVSHRDSRHVRHILLNDRVAVAIFDSKVPEGKGRGLQFGGYAHVLTQSGDIDEAIRASAPRLPMEEEEERIARRDRWLRNGRVIVRVIVDEEGIFINRFDGQKDWRERVQFPSKIGLSSFRAKL
jgi:uncharacterized protein YhbP (UPF0306 family)